VQEKLQEDYKAFCKIRLRWDKRKALHQKDMDCALEAAWDIIKQYPEAMKIVRSEQHSPDKKAIIKTNNAALDYNAEGMRLMKEASKAFQKSRGALDDQASLLDDETMCLD
jgi:hypothetical protein